MAKTTYKERQQRRRRAANRNAEAWWWSQIDAGLKVMGRAGDAYQHNQPEIMRKLAETVY